jgi:uncharacterized RDD family membrane protein YckC/predicted RNA-binding Zn-ribbon protein involved in translation (DUF1610 family)
MAKSVFCSCGEVFEIKQASASGEVPCPKCGNLVSCRDKDSGNGRGNTADSADSTESKIEILADCIKFFCKCGQKVSVPVPSPQSIGKCPKCGDALEVPTVPGVTDRKSPVKVNTKSVTSERSNCQQCGRRIEEADSLFCPRCGKLLDRADKVQPTAESSKSSESAQVSQEKSLPDNVKNTDLATACAPSPVAIRSAELPLSSMEPGIAGIGRRVLGFVIDMLLCGFFAAVGLLVARENNSNMDSSVIFLVAVCSGGGFALLNGAVFAGMSGGRSIGMVVCGTWTMSLDGRPAGFVLMLVRLLASLPLLPLAPLALLDRRRRALHDIICGTVVKRMEY